MNIICVVGARPNFMKIAPILEAAKKRGLKPLLLHTGQHFDAKMSEIFFEQLGLPKPDINLGINSGSHAYQTAKIMEAFDTVLDENPTDLVIVVGDVNSTLACTLVAAKRSIKVAHVEAGLRSGDRAMPEELNRIVTDHLSDYLFTTEDAAKINLEKEGISAERIYFVGNVMIDTLLKHRQKAKSSLILQQLQLKPKDYAVCTMHRPSNVDSRDVAENTVQAILNLAAQITTVIPLHPRTAAKWKEYELISSIIDHPNIKIIEPQGYLDFLALQDQAKLILTDSGGIQEEATVLGVPCLTFRENTERPVTITHGTNTLLGTDPNKVGAATKKAIQSKTTKYPIPPLWDGHAAERIIEQILNLNI